MNFQGTLIGIGGVSRSGKSTLATELARLWKHQGKLVSIYDMDDFVKEETDIPTIRDRIDWEHPDSIDSNRLMQRLSAHSGEIAIVDGIFTFVFPWLTKRAGCLIKVDLDETTFYTRKSMDHRWGYQPEWYLRHIWEANSNLVRDVTADFILDGSTVIDYRMIFHELDNFLFKRS